jgi:hypothetical protein
MCFGVRDAIAKVLRAGAREPLTVLGELVHNGTVLEKLAARGIRLRHEVAEVDTPSVAITAHGASERRRAAVRERDLRVLDATCPIVRAAHRAVTALAADGFHPVIVGTPNHVEVRGLTEDLDAFDVISTEEDVERLQPPEMAIAPALESQPRTGPVEPRTALLVNPFYAKSPHGSFGKHVLTPSLALTSITAATPPGWRVRYWDENLLQGPPPIEPVPQVVGITVHLTFARRAYELAAWYRARGSKVVLGGLHIQACEEEAASQARPRPPKRVPDHGQHHRDARLPQPVRVLLPGDGNPPDALSRAQPTGRRTRDRSRGAGVRRVPRQ